MQSQTLPITRAPARSYSLHDPAYQAFMLLRTAFTVAPIAFGVDKASNLLIDWQRYLSPTIDQLVPGTANQLMLAVGLVEVIAGVLVGLRPQLGAYLVAGWLAGIILNLLLIPGFYDVALRDFGLLVAALALARLAQAFRTQPRGVLTGSAS
ncbi:MAG TPA: hypothetical protein VK390_17855 [Propionibacteriaceae bacterium]|nr:hypothetical protein [Propionibacteriaceae bacterium]